MKETYIQHRQFEKYKENFKVLLRPGDWGQYIENHQHQMPCVPGSIETRLGEPWCVDTCICIYIHIHIHIHTCTHKHIYMHAHVHTYICTHAHTKTYLNTSTYADVGLNLRLSLGGWLRCKDPCHKGRQLSTATALSRALLCLPSQWSHGSPWWVY